MAQTLTAGILQQAALMRNDESVLIYIQGRDCVAIEAPVITDDVIYHTRNALHVSRRLLVRHCTIKRLMSFALK